MKIYSQFPMMAVTYNGVTIGGLLALGGLIAGRFSAWFLLGYILWGASAMIATWAVICSRCGYYGRRCGLIGSGKITALIFKKGNEALYFRTKPQLFIIVMWGVLLISGFLAATASAFKGDWPYSLVYFGLLLAVVAPHARINCRHCEQAHKGACPVGRKIINTGGAV